MNIDPPPLVIRDAADPKAVTEHARRMATAIVHIIGNIRTGRVTFANGSTSTALDLIGLSALFGHVQLTPMNAAAQAITWRAAYQPGQVTFTHGAPVGAANFSYLAVLA